MCAAAVLRVAGALLVASVLVASSACHRSMPPETATAGAAERPDERAPGEGYAGSDACAGCHEEQLARWYRSLHPTMLTSADTAAVVPEGAPPPPAGALHDVAYVVTGRHLKRFVGRDDAGLFMLGVQYWRAAKRWVPWKPGRAGERDRYSYAELCAGCHSTGGRPERGVLGELGVGCEACHGPAAAHAADPDGKAMIELAGLPPERLLMVCGRCHSVGADPSGKLWYAVGYLPGGDLDRFYRHAEPAIGDLDRSWPKLKTAAFWPDGTTAKHRQQYLGLRAGPHGSEAGVGCIDCHDPHGPGEDGADAHAHLLLAPPAELCGGCHETEATDPGHGHHAPAEADCVDCHMPKLGFIGKPNASADHACRVPDPARSEKLSTPSACIVCHTHADRDDRWAVEALEGLRAKKAGAKR